LENAAQWGYINEKVKIFSNQYDFEVNSMTKLMSALAYNNEISLEYFPPPAEEATLFWQTLGLSNV
jgi:hypothetical protein